MKQVQKIRKDKKSQNANDCQQKQQNRSPHHQDDQSLVVPQNTENSGVHSQHKQPSQLEQQSHSKQQGEQQQLGQQYQELELPQDDLDEPKKADQRGVCYISRIPPYMKPNYVKKLLEQYDVLRVYFVPQSEWIRKKRIKSGGNKKICFKQGWIEFADKKVARLAAMALNGQRMVQKKGNFYHEDLWTLKYLPKFRWHHLTQRLAHEQRLKRERLNVQLSQQQKMDQFYSKQAYKSKMINSIINKKVRKGNLKQEKQKHRKFHQSKMLEQENQ